MRGSMSSARAIAIRWRCPPESDSPLSDDRVVPCGSSRMKSCACAACAAASTASCGASGIRGDVVANRRGEEERILRDDPDLLRKDREQVANVDPVDEHLPAVAS